MKKIISYFLVLATLISCLAVSVYAEEMIVSDEGRLPFADVKSDHWFFDAVKFCYVNDVIKGMNEYTFSFSGQLTRAQFVTMLAGLEGIDTSTYTVDQFADVKSNHWYYGVVAWAYSEGIVKGMNETTFAPNGVLTRAQLATVMCNYMIGKYYFSVDESVLDKFTDKPKKEYWYYDAMVYAVSAGLLSGNSNGTLAPVGTVTRAQAAVIFNSFMEKYFYAKCEHSFTVADCVTASSCEKCGFVNGLPNGHRLYTYDCITGGKCSVCEAEVAPSTILHNFTEATCTAPMTCTRCGI
ncbi:MAG: S-layer homology domain-containing protein, partial [Clostridia bacterium]|nr:S-layer homology domain-containing protein [Clostridia bacterium]